MVLEAGTDMQLMVRIARSANDEQVDPSTLALSLSRPSNGSSETDRALFGTFLESWYGKSFSDSPLYIFQEMQNRGLPGPYYAVVADRSVDVPEGCTPIVSGSTEYWQALHSSKFVILNTWQPTGYVKQRGQIVVQTWHGTPLKHLGIDTPERQGKKSGGIALAKGSRIWDVLVTQNMYSTEILRRAYCYDGPVAEIGYPRNDILSSNAPSIGSVEVRHVLGIPEDARVVLYAPTWREDSKGDIGPTALDVFLRSMPSDVWTILRGHSVSLRRGKDAHYDRAVDATSYPNSSELLLAADLLITDYSSIMFDFAITRKPIVYYTPDYDEYLGDDGRGGYFDLALESPGPICSNLDELSFAVEQGLSPAWEPSASYHAWVEKFCSNDDGSASSRMVDTMLEL